VSTGRNGIDHNAHEQAKRYRGAAAAMGRELDDALAWLAPRVTATMREEAPKYLSNLTNSITAEKQERWSWIVRPNNVAYAGIVHRGVKAGGKGLPKYDDPAALSVIGWLQAHMQRAAIAANPKFRKPRAGSARRSAWERELQARYMALSRHIKLRGTKPNPFVTRTAGQWRTLAPATLRAAVRRSLDGTGFEGAIT
jgi:hypothetical protein